MASVVYALVLLGCSDDGDQCQAALAAPAMFQTRLACEAQIERALNSDLAARIDAPSVYARCEVRSGSASGARKSNSQLRSA